MTKIYFKLIMVAMALILSVSVVFMSSYAWMVLSKSPAVSGIQVAIGGGNTILIAPDIRRTENGKVHSYPGRFSDKINFGQFEEYTYLKNVGGLTPVSTANGIDWLIPVFYSGTSNNINELVIKSEELGSTFIMDSELVHANLTADDEELIRNGNYVYLDFWVVSPGGDYTLRTSTGEGTESGGSFVIDLAEPVHTSENGWSLEEPEGSASSAIRIGFLANDLKITDDSMLSYKDSYGYDERFKSLKGIYHEPHTGTTYFSENRFMIYEPNADFHPENKAPEGSYVQTKPLALSNGEVIETIVNNTAIQLKSTWAQANTGTGTVIDQQFRTSIASKIPEELESAEKQELMGNFYGNYLQGQISTFVNKGRFITRASTVETLLGDGIITKEEIEELKNPTAQNAVPGVSGASADTYIIKLEKNVPQKIRMFIWLEGQDVDCTSITGAVQFAVNIEFAGATE